MITTELPLDKKTHKLWAVLQYHNYRKEHFGKVLGVFSKLDLAESHINSSTTDYMKTCFNKNCEIIKSNEKTIVILNDDGEESEWMIFKIDEIEATFDTSLPICIELQYEFPKWVISSSQPTNCYIKNVKNLDKAFEGDYEQNLRFRPVNSGSQDFMEKSKNLKGSTIIYVIIDQKN